MRRLYLVRHGEPYFPNGEKICVGTTDIPLSSFGRLQACAAGAELRDLGFERVFSSPLVRALDTAKAICPEVTVCGGLIESYAGDWEGLSFSEISRGWPELFSDRGRDQNLPIPGAEDIRVCAERFSAAVSEVLEQSGGDTVIVAHATVMQAYLCGFLGVPIDECRNVLLPYGSYSVLETGGGETKLTLCGAVPSVPLSEELCEELMKAAGLREDTAAHCRRVAEKAAEITDALNGAGYALDRELTFCSALLHDIARSEPDHAHTGGQWLERLGYPEAGALVSRHHDILPLEISETAVLSIADRCIAGAEEVTIDGRFMRSAAKCTGAAAHKAHAERYENAASLRELINSAAGRELVR